MQISRLVTLWLIPIPIAFSLTYYSNCPLLPLNIIDVIKGAFFGYGLLFLTNYIFQYCSGKNGMGQGDLDLLALIGAFTGVAGAWISLMIASVTGSILGIILMSLANYRLEAKIPFGPFLALGTICYVLFQNQILQFMF